MVQNSGSVVWRRQIDPRLLLVGTLVGKRRFAHLMGYALLDYPD